MTRLSERDPHRGRGDDDRADLRVCGRARVEVRAKRSGDGYSARVRVPPRGLRKVIVGLQGWKTADGRTTRADRYFQFDPPLARDCA